MLKRILTTTMLSGALLFAAPHAAFADGRHGDRDNYHRNPSEHHDRGRDRDDYYRHYGDDDDYYRYYGYRCDGYRDGYYYGPDGRPYYGDNYHRNPDCDDYYRRYGSYYGTSYCDSYDYQTGYCNY